MSGIMSEQLHGTLYISETAVKVMNHALGKPSVDQAFCLFQGLIKLLKQEYHLTVNLNNKYRIASDSVLRNRRDLVSSLSPS